MTRDVHLDVETFSALDVRRVGAYRYAEDPSTEVLIACYAIDGGPVRVWLPGRSNSVPQDLLNALRDGARIHAHNAEFERQIYRHVLRKRFPELPAVPLRRFRCSAVRAATAGLRRSLDGALSQLGTVVQKDKRGAALIKLFCSYRKPTKKDPRTRIRPEDEPAAFKEFIQYCKTDVEGERTLERVLPEMSASEWKDYHFICQMNDRGLPIDIKSVRGAIKTVAQFERQMVKRTMELTGGIRPTQVQKLIEWLNKQGCDISSLKFKEVMRKIKDERNKVVREVLNLRVEASRASTKKLHAMEVFTCRTGKAHGTFLPYGAHTGRIAGRGIQPHNYTRGLLKPAHQISAIRAFATGDSHVAKLLLDKPMSELSQSMRGYIKAPQGKKFYVADYASIEARITAFLAGEQKLLKIYHRNMGLPKEQQIDLYRTMASTLYQVPYDKVESEQRRIGKNLRLGAIYQLGVNGLLVNCEKEEIEISEDLATRAIRTFRQENPKTVRMWYALEETAIDVAMGARSGSVNGVGFEMYRKRDFEWLVVTLLSGRRLWYFKPSTRTVEKFGRVKTALSYVGEIKKGVLGNVSMYGGKWTENIVQGTAYDLMMLGMYAAEDHEYPVIGSVHDEIVTMRDDGTGNVHALEKLICVLPPWARGLPLAAEGFECYNYRKN